MFSLQSFECGGSLYSCATELKQCRSTALFKRKIKTFLLTSSCDPWWVCGGRRHPPRRPWVSHEEGENNEKIDTVDTILIHSGNIASYMLTQWSHVMMFAIVIFKICRQLLRASLLRPWAPLGTSVSQTLGSFRLLFVAQVSMCYISSFNARS